MGCLMTASNVELSRTAVSASLTLHPATQRRASRPRGAPSRFCNATGSAEAPWTHAGADRGLETADKTRDFCYSANLA